MRYAIIIILMLSFIVSGCAERPSMPQNTVAHTLTNVTQSCNSTYEGSIFHNSSDHLSYVCNGSTWQHINNEFYIAQYHHIGTILTLQPDTWFNISWNYNEENVTTQGFEKSDDNETIYINNPGVYRINGVVHPYANTSATDIETFYLRILHDGKEARESQYVTTKEFNSYAVDTISFETTIHAFEFNNVSKVTLQYYVTSTGIEIKGDEIFNNPVAASMNFERIVDKDG